MVGGKAEDIIFTSGGTEVTQSHLCFVEIFQTITNTQNDYFLWLFVQIKQISLALST